MSDRRQRVLDAAIDVLGTGGMRLLTHRAVDAEAGLPLGSTSNFFRTREALLAGVLERILERETLAWNGLAGAAQPLDPASFATALARLIKDLSTGKGRTLTRARQAIFVEAGGKPELRQRIAEGQAQLAAWGLPVIEALGSGDPARDLLTMLALVEGLLTNQLANPARDFDPESAITTLLRGMLR